jgi:hypothetical protein
LLRRVDFRHYNLLWIYRITGFLRCVTDALRGSRNRFVFLDRRVVVQEKKISPDKHSKDERYSDQCGSTAAGTPLFDDRSMWLRIVGHDFSPSFVRKKHPDRFNGSRTVTSHVLMARTVFLEVTLFTFVQCFSERVTAPPLFSCG